MTAMKESVALPSLRPNWLKLSFTALLLLMFLGLLLSIIGAEFGVVEMTEYDRGLFRFMSPLLLFACYFLVHSLFRTITTVAVDSTTRTLALKTFGGKESPILIDQLTGYSAMSGADGIVLYTKDGKHFQLSEWSTTSVMRFAESLNERGVPFLGFEWVWWPFGKSKYRYDCK